MPICTVLLDILHHAQCQLICTTFTKLNGYTQQSPFFSFKTQMLFFFFFFHKPSFLLFQIDNSNGIHIICKVQIMVRATDKMSEEAAFNVFVHIVWIHGQNKTKRESSAYRAKYLVSHQASCKMSLMDVSV